MHCSEEQTKLRVCQHTPIFATITTHDSRPLLKQEYIRKIATDTCLVGIMPHPHSSRIPPGLLRSRGNVTCTYTTRSGNSGLKMYPYSEYRLCDCTLNLRRPRRKGLCNKYMSIYGGMPFNKYGTPKLHHSRLGHCVVFYDPSQILAGNCCPHHKSASLRQSNLSFSSMAMLQDHVMQSTSGLNTRQDMHAVNSRPQHALTRVPELGELSNITQFTCPISYQGSSVLIKRDPDMPQNASVNDISLSINDNSTNLNSLTMQRQILDPRGFEAYANLLKEVHIR